VLRSPSPSPSPTPINRGKTATARATTQADGEGNKVAEGGSKEDVAANKAADAETNREGSVPNNSRAKIGLEWSSTTSPQGS